MATQRTKRKNWLMKGALVLIGAVLSVKIMTLVAKASPQLAATLDKLNQDTI
jgi:hypothetical protein